MYFGVQKMAIRTLAAAAALLAFTGSAFAGGLDPVVIENEPVVVEDISMIGDTISLGGFSVGKTAIIIAGVIAAIVIIADDGTASVTTAVSTDG